jgi:hypothetical protein
VELPNKSAVRSYKTEFARSEAPISEGGLWLNGRRDGIDWCDVLVRDGVAYGEVSRMRAAERRVEQASLGAGIEGAPVGVFSRKQTDRYFQEVQIRLRHNMSAHFCNGYEVFFRCLRTDAGYAEIVRWNGRNGDFTSLAKLVGLQYGVQDGDLIEASIVGNVITGYLNGARMISVTDDKIASGAPGIGFNFGVGDTNVDHGLTYFEVHSYN